MTKPSTLNSKPSTVFSNYARYQDLLYRDKDYGHLDRFPARIGDRFHARGGDRFQICPPFPNISSLNSIGAPILHIDIGHTVRPEKCPMPVIPAKAGIHKVSKGLDSRLRGNDNNVYEVTVGMGYRATYFRDGAVYVWFWIGTHN